MNSLTRIMSYDKSVNQENCNCEKCVSKIENISVEIENIKVNDFLRKIENHQMMYREHEILNIINSEYWHKDIKTKTFIWKSLFINGNKYDYSQVEYINCKTKVYIKCKKHNYYFWQAPTKHLSGQGCPICGKEKQIKNHTLTTEEFIEKANITHGIGKYNYSKVKYVNANTEVIIICPKHGEFLQTPHIHLSGHGCPMCKYERLSNLHKLTTEEFIELANETHGLGKYDYSKVKYINANEDVIIICPKHGEFSQRASHHLSGHGCPTCSGNKKSTTEEFIEKANDKQGYDTYDYSKVEYINAKTEVVIICPKHGEFSQTPTNHLNGDGCPKCAIEKCADERRLTTKEFIDKANQVQGIGIYDYSKVQYVDAHTEVTIICPKHGEFKQTPNNHLNCQGCPKCKNNYKGEIIIRKFLTKNKMNFEEQKKFENCKDIRCLPFDFYIPKYNLCIEHDGIQHFKPTKRSNKTTDKESKENFKYIQKHDKIKNNYCKEKGINLLRIRYDENVEEKLTEYFQNNNLIKD